MHNKSISDDAFLWALQGICTLHRKAFASKIVRQQFPNPLTASSLAEAASALGFNARLKKKYVGKISREQFPLIAWLAPKVLSDDVVHSDLGAETARGGHAERRNETATPALLLNADNLNVLVIEPGDPAPRTLSNEDFEARYLGYVTGIAPKEDHGTDDVGEAFDYQNRKFDFSWFVPELLKYKRLWHEIILASLVIQLIALASPLFTQAIIDKVVVHHTQSTLVVIAIGMTLFVLFSAAGLSWIRQYLVLHTGNRVDAMLGTTVFERLFRLPRGEQFVQWRQRS